MSGFGFGFGIPKRPPPSGGGGAFATFAPPAEIDTTLSNGNLTWTHNSGLGWRTQRTTISKTSGKPCWLGQTAPGSTYSMVGICNASASGTSYLGVDGNGCGYLSNGQVFLGGAVVATFAAYTDANVIKLAWDVAGKALTFYRDGTLQGTVDVSSITGPCFGAASTYQTADSITMNFGQTTVSPPETYDDGLYS